MVKIREVTAFLEEIAPLGYQESYDNAGLITGNPEAEVSGILVSLDAIEGVIDEAIARNCNLIIAHHPIVFKGLKSLTGKNYVERTLIKVIKNDIAIYAIHTNLDHVSQGVNRKICEKIGLEQLQILAPKSGTLAKLVTFVPVADTDKVVNALSDAGAGSIGNYSKCSFQISGTGTFEPNEQANPHIGQANQLERVEEKRVEMIFPKPLTGRVLKALQNAHPYESVAYDLYNLENENPEVGAGMIGELPAAMKEEDFLRHLKESMSVNMIRHTRLLGKPLKKVAVCGGAGSFLLDAALRQKADVFVTADYKYHEFFDADGRLIIADIGHYESEVHTKELLGDLLSKKFITFAVHLAKTVTNPVFYF